MCENSDIKISFLNSKTQINDIVEIHMNAFPNFFLTFLGKGFLKQLYLSYYEDSNSNIIICEKGNKIVGFVAYSGDYSGFYKRILRKRFFQFSYYSFLALLKQPSILKRLLTAFKKSEDVKKDEAYVELASIAVDVNMQHCGVGKKLIDYLKQNVDFNCYSYINLETDAINNNSTNNFYKDNGFVLYRQYASYGERLMNEYRYNCDK